MTGARNVVAAISLNFRALSESDARRFLLEILTPQQRERFEVERGLRELDPKIWFTAIRKDQTPMIYTGIYASPDEEGTYKPDPKIVFTY